MTPETAAALRCPVCGGALLLVGRSLRCPKAHSFDLAKEGYAYGQHHPKVKFDDSILYEGSAAYSWFALRWLSEHK